MSGLTSRTSVIKVDSGKFVTGIASIVGILLIGLITWGASTLQAQTVAIAKIETTLNTVVMKLETVATEQAKRAKSIYVVEELTRRITILESKLAKLEEHP